MCMHRCRDDDDDDDDNDDDDVGNQPNESLKKEEIKNYDFSAGYACLLKREEGGGSIIIQAMAQPQQLQQQNIQQQSIEVRPMDHDEKKMRRQIANSNERRRMQSINAGFQSLRQLLPHHEGEKLSKKSSLSALAHGELNVCDVNATLPQFYRLGRCDGHTDEGKEEVKM
ncbi:CLUMA_CG007390, isoform A [Clunio marinus]|uniref:CLUMA_CG007390, isoform A n=1 Tax=Clunio marinus TaxID=568069 RepID=A0A1J1I0I8_9DIPT|nr:CLUMA_CG007390, isoform A [Clunio marinus]